MLLQSVSKKKRKHVILEGCCFQIPDGCFIGNHVYKSMLHHLAILRNMFSISMKHYLAPESGPGITVWSGETCCREVKDWIEAASTPSSLHLLSP